MDESKVVPVFKLKRDALDAIVRSMQSVCIEMERTSDSAELLEYAKSMEKLAFAYMEVK